MIRRFLFLVLVLFLVGCTAIPTAQISTPEPTQPGADPAPTATPAPEDNEPTPAPAGPVTISIWLPPQFDPEADTPEGQLLKDRLETFAGRRDELEITTRVKNVDGFGGILDTLSTASSAAPSAVPDLVALPRHAMETAAVKGLLYSFAGLTFIMDDPDWYDYARQLSDYQQSTYGIPFAGDGLVLVYRPAAIPSPPADWVDTLLITNTLAFPAGDPSALFTLAQYQTVGGEVLTDDDYPTLDPFMLTGVFSYYHQANLNELMPGWLTQFETDDQSWEVYQEGNADMAITWVSRYLEENPEDSLAVTFPTSDGIPFSLADGWVWALTTQDPDKQLLVAQLVEFLTIADFMGEWTEAASLLPPRPSVVTLWENAGVWNLVSQISTSAQLIPPVDVVTTLGPALQPSVISVLRAETDPVSAAESAVEKLGSP